MRKKIIQTLFIFIINIILYAIPAYAEERTAFGSESYEWELDGTFPIGIYAHSLQIIDTAEIYVEYDATMLEYHSGGELIEPGYIKIQGVGDGTQEFKQILEFRPIMAGNTQITIQESTIATAMGETYRTQSINVSVRIPFPVDCLLEEITINGLRIENFETTVNEYEFRVDSDVENIVFATLPQALQTEISKNVLEIGMNEIHIIVTSALGQKGRYTLHITRDEMNNINIEVPEPQMLMQGDAQGSVMWRTQIVLYVVLAILFGTLLWLIFIKIRLSRAVYEKKDIQKGSSIRYVEWSTDENIEKNIDEDAEKVIEVKDVTMSFKRDKDESSSIKEHLIKRITGKHSYDTFNALNDVSFHINAGEVVGIIGTNGSGKSTILKIISGVLTPTKGSVRVNASRVQLLTLGTGFDRELTGRENVYLNGAILGYTKEYIDEQYEKIVEFAELQDFMDEKVKNYSSGMVSRLGFAIATRRNAPEVLILDEVLSVGDLFFKRKSEKRIQEMIQGGSTVLIVSHATSVIKKNCSKVVWIEKGVLRKVGNPGHVCSAYEKANMKK